ncbi:MAG: HsdR family type I site-specific deoxyribonuclease, partial [Oscillibacter sp.]|nr:HsdR family type I site-specific deoxyribonuclease [Oscillibacter sp.]
MAEYNGSFCECDFEAAFLSYLEGEGWQYLPGNSIPRASRREVLYEDDLEQFLSGTNPDLTAGEIRAVMDTVRLAGAESDFATLHKVYRWMVDGIQFTPRGGAAKMVALIDFDRPDRNLFRAVNQFTVEYTRNAQTETRRPDILLYVNGMPLCVLELKNPASPHATIYDAWEQITVRYWRDIPHLLHYCPLACISDGVKTRLGTVRTPYEHFYAWRRVHDGDKVSTLPFEETRAMIRGVYSPKRFLEIFRDYIYFPDDLYDSEQREIVCRYPQFFAARLLKQSIIQSVTRKSGRGGTYFGATGCGKTYTMAFLARQLALRCRDVPEIGSPTVVMIVDRDELQKQGAQLFSKSTDFLNLGEVRVIPSRDALRKELRVRDSGGFYICTMQKFCDRKDDKIGLINDRANIICFSDEAHRTQLEQSRQIRFSKNADENMKALISKPYAKVLREAFPHATFVGFTGTPVAETYQTFGDEIDRYTMDQAVADGLTVPIKYHPRIAKVLLDEEKVRLIEDYYKKCADDGATREDIEASKRAMSSMEIILGERSRLERLAADIHDHYAAACDADPGRVQKAMIACASRPIAYELLKVFRDKYPEWFVERKTPDGISASNEESQQLPPLPLMAMVASVGANDPKDMYDYLGGTA